MDPQELMFITLKFNEKINEQDPAALAELMTEDHTFIDSDNTVTKGKNAMKKGWQQFFKTYPDYKNTFTNVTTQNNIVIMIGYSTCTYKPLNGPNIWTAKIRGKQVSEWRVIWLNQRKTTQTRDNIVTREQSYDAVHTASAKKANGLMMTL